MMNGQRHQVDRLRAYSLVLKCREADSFSALKRIKRAVQWTLRRPKVQPLESH